MPKAAKDARSARRFAGASDENDQRTADRQMRTDESYPWSYQASSNADAFMTPDQHDKQHTTHQRQEYDWHYQETPPAQIQHSRQPKMYRQHVEGVAGDDDAAHGFKTPEPDTRAARRPPVTHAPANNHSTAHTSDGDQQYQTAAEFAQSQYRRRNRLEKRLEELQKDVASLTLKLRSSSNRSNSTGYLSTDKITPPPAPLSEIPLNSERVNREDRLSMQTQPQQMQRKMVKPPSPVVKVKKTRPDKPRTVRSNLSEHSTTPTKGRMSSHVSVSTMRELHKVTTERDQLRFELEKVRTSLQQCIPSGFMHAHHFLCVQMKRTLTTTEKKYDEAMKAREALEKLKAHCESLQESLDLSEKIRVRQKKLLQQLQLNQQQAQAQQQMQKPRRTTEAGLPAAALKSKEATSARQIVRKKQSSTNYPTSDVAHDARSRYATPQYQQPEYDILDSLVNQQRPRPSNPRASTQDHQRFSHRAPVAATTTRSTLHSGTTQRPRTHPAAKSALAASVHGDGAAKCSAQSAGSPPTRYYLSNEPITCETDTIEIAGSTHNHNASCKTDQRRRELYKNEAQHIVGANAGESPAHAGPAAPTRRAQTTVHLDRSKMSMSDALVEKTYQALLTVVQTTALSRKVLQRPPFTFLHKLLVETLADYDIFTYQQLEFADLVTKEDKAAFLTRAIAFVTFAMANINSKRISCLLLVSPIKVLAGVAVEDTHEFLLQLCEVCKSPDREAKDAAAQDVISKGDAQLYTSGVSFRKGLLLIQAIVRSFIKRRTGKRKVLQHNGLRGSFPLPPVAMAQGTRFLKEFADGRVYDGVIKEVSAKVYVLGYEQDPGARDEVDEIEMKIILEESQRLSLLRERMTTKNAAADDADISLTGLPDLSLPLIKLETPQQLKPKLIKRVSSRDSSVLLTPKRIKPGLSRSQSQRFQCDSSSSELSSTQSSFRRDKLEPSLSRLSSYSGDMMTTSAELPEHEHDANNNDDEKPWQASLKKMLAFGQEPLPRHTAASGMGKAATPPLVASLKKSTLDALPADATGSRASTSNNNVVFQPPHLLNFPKLSIPGTKSLAPMTVKKKRLLPQKATASPGIETLGKSKSQQLQPAGTPTSTTTAMGTGTSNPTTSRPVPLARGASMVSFHGWGSNNAASASTTGDRVLDAAFAGTYQTTDQKTQEKLTLFREIVRRIDGYMKRKHLRVIDLFRFCDADGNGSISPQEMIDTLSQMEIQLTVEQGQDFINYIDKDGDGSIDIDEFEELVRVARRNEAQREQLRKELNHPKKAPIESKASGKYSAFIKHRQRICDEFKSADVGDIGALSVSQMRSILLRLDIPGVDDLLVDALIEKALTVGNSTSSSSLSSTAGASRSTAQASPSSSSSSSAASSSSSAASTAAVSAANANGMIYLHQLCRSLEDLEWSKKSNRFLDQSWISQFDSQMERAIREFELL